jgi:transcriptional regulator with XRE-family HTH domain
MNEFLEQHPDLETIALKLKQLRKARGWNQTQLAEVCGVEQSLVSRWERALNRPNPIVLAKLAQLSSEEDRDWWFAEAGLSHLASVEAPVPDDVRQIPLLHDASAAGTPRAVEAGAVELYFTLPSNLLPPGGKIYAVRVNDGLMFPRISRRSIVFVDVAQRDTERLEGRLVAVRKGDGIVVRSLHRNEEVFLLLPSRASQINILRSDGDFSLIGAVVKWIDGPPERFPEKRRPVFSVRK